MTHSSLIFAVLAFVGGMLVAAQGPIYARLSAGLNRDFLLAVFLAFSTAAALTGALAFLSGSLRNLTVTTLTHLPLWVWLGGVFGAIHVVISMQSIPNDDGEFKQAEDSAIQNYIDALEKNRIPVTVRRSRGKDIDAACGQLANKH